MIVEFYKKNLLKSNIFFFSTFEFKLSWCEFTATWCEFTGTWCEFRGTQCEFHRYSEKPYTERYHMLQSGTEALAGPSFHHMS